MEQSRLISPHTFAQLLCLPFIYTLFTSFSHDTTTSPIQKIKHETLKFLSSRFMNASTQPSSSSCWWRNRKFFKWWSFDLRHLLHHSWHQQQFLTCFLSFLSLLLVNDVHDDFWWLLNGIYISHFIFWIENCVNNLLRIFNREWFA